MRHKRRAGCQQAERRATAGLCTPTGASAELGGRVQTGIQTLPKAVQPTTYVCGMNMNK